MTRQGWTRRRFLHSAALTGVALSQHKALQVVGTESSTPNVPPVANKIFYEQPASSWPDALPVGNGRLGAMVFGNPAKEHLQLNEETVWMGERRDRNNPQANRTAEVRKLLLEGKVHEAESLAQQTMMGIPDRLPCYQTLGDLWIDSEGVPAEVENYRLELDLDEAVVKTRFTSGEADWSREVFSSAAKNLLVVHMKCTRPMNLTVRLDRPAHSETHVSSSNRLVMTGVARPVKATVDPVTQERQAGIAFRAELQAHVDGGNVQAVGNALRITNARVVTLLLAAATDFRERDKAGMTAACEGRMHGAAAQSYANLRAEHVADYAKFARRAEIHLIDGPDPLRDVPTDKRVQRVKDGGEDHGLVETYFRYGRYMLISSSRPGSLPANLQGIWNESLDPPWGSKYTVNINAQMNYWIAETGNLPELHPQLFDLLDRTREMGAKTAKQYYNARGFVVHHNTDIWGDTIPVDHVQAGVWAMGAAWMSLHSWEHYAYNGNLQLLKERIYPRLREIAEFLLDYLVEAPDGHLLSGPSQSPENKYRLPDGSTASLCMAPAMDTQIVRAVFDRVARCSELLHVDAELRAQVQAASKRLPPIKVGKSGSLQEWNEDYAETELGHRHVSHLFALYPDNQITVRETPELALAARKVLERRLENGGGSTGWSRAWIINCWARLEDGEAAYKSVLELLRHSTRHNLFDVCGMKANAPFQIDGNLGGAAGLMEMLLQSHSGVIRLLPALPTAWPTGHFRGLRARGGVEVDCNWRDGKATSATLRSTVDGTVKLAVSNGQRIVRVSSKDGSVRLTQEADGAVSATLRKDSTYTVSLG